MRNILKATTLESKFPLLAVEGGCIISKDADITVAYRVELPELDVNEVLKKMQGISLSLHCWQTDDVSGFENPPENILNNCKICFLPGDKLYYITCLPGREHIHIVSVQVAQDGRKINDSRRNERSVAGS